jgi:hypothetical protein
MSLFDNDNLPILAAFAIAAPEIFAAEAIGGEAATAGSAEAAAQEAARQEAARIAAEEAAKQAAEEAAKQAAQEAANQGILQTGTQFTGALPQNYVPGQVDALTQGAGQGINVAGPMTTPPAPLSSPVTAADRAVDLGYEGITSQPQNAPLVNGEPYQAPSGILEQTPKPSSLMDGFTKFAETNPRSTAALGYVGAYNMGLLDPRKGDFNNQSYSGPLNNYRLSPNFQGRTANPRDYQYTPRQYAAGGILSAAGGGPVEQMSNANALGANTGYPMADINKATYSTPYQTPVSQNVVQGTADTGVNSITGEQNFAAGGIASYAKGGNLSNTLEYYTDMMDGRSQRPAATSRLTDSDVGIYRDNDPDTMYLDPVSAAQVRMAKLNKRANIQGMNMKRPTPMGQLNLKPPGAKAEAGGSSLDPENAAQGGIMQAHGHLGGYAAGGNARLLKGPGDGMSDNIPATIAGKQPARLADGEFVVPADVVSHLGNGSTEAGAKKLHEMMTKVRKARTGNPKQGKQINPSKFTPK